ncbi:hypothetical protein BDZ88DRAFT_160247 [Geranomyces variabilis]|nr:hypothetical protein BDZ88DRAFT_160247 [Geranomyces variabilis]
MRTCSPVDKADRSLTLRASKACTPIKSLRHCVCDGSLLTDDASSSLLVVGGTYHVFIGVAIFSACLARLAAGSQLISSTMSVAARRMSLSVALLTVPLVRFFSTSARRAIHRVCQLSSKSYGCASAAAVSVG